jgi:hypothetical protein
LRAVRAKAATPPRESKAEASAELARRRAAQLEAEAGAKESHARQAAAAVFKAREQLRELEKAARDATRTASKSRRLADRASARKT